MSGASSGQAQDLAAENRELSAKNARLEAEVARRRAFVERLREGITTWCLSVETDENPDPKRFAKALRALLSAPAPEGRLVPEAEWRALGADVIAERDALRAYILQSGGDDSLLAWIATHGAEEAAKIRRVAEAARDHVRGCSVLHHELKDSVLAWKPQDREAVAAVEQARRQEGRG